MTPEKEDMPLDERMFWLVLVVYLSLPSAEFFSRLIIVLPYLMCSFCILDSDICKTSIFDLHRSCGNCSFDLCLACCQELREGQLRGYGAIEHTKCTQEERTIFSDGMPDGVTVSNIERNVLGSCPENLFSQSADWKVDVDGNIPCPPEEMGGCQKGILNLKCIFPANWILELVKSAEKISGSDAFRRVISNNLVECYCSSLDNNKNLRKAASREGTVDNHLYCPLATDIHTGDLEHFHAHWRKGEPVIVRDVLKLSSGLSWEPMVLYRAVLEKKNSKARSKTGLVLDVKAIDCLDWREVDIYFKHNTSTLDVQMFRKID